MPKKKLKDLIKDFTDVELKESVLELNDWNKTAILKDGRVRDFAHKIKEYGIDSHHCLNIAEKEVLREASIRFANIVESRRR